MGINAGNTVKEIEMDLSFVSNASGIVIDEEGEGFLQKAVSKNKIESDDETPWWICGKNIKEYKFS